MVTGANKSNAAEERRRIVGVFGEFVANHAPLPTRIEDESVLPFPKKVILEAILLEIVRHGEARTEPHRNCARCLAQFQREVGPEALELTGVDLTTLNLPSAEDKAAWIAHATLISEAAESTRTTSVFLSRRNSIQLTSAIKISNGVEARISRRRARSAFSSRGPSWNSSVLSRNIFRGTDTISPAGC